MRNIRMTIGYDGTDYHGFQVQPGVPSIQAALIEAIAAITGETAAVHGSGRTDAGVHARAQVVNFVTSSRLPADRWCQALNARLPNDIVVWKAEEAPLTFHARKSSKRKTYCYTINGNRYPDPLNRRTEFHHPGSLDVSAMREAIRHLEGEHDFTSFCSVRAASESKVRTVYEAQLTQTAVEGMESATGVGRLRLFFTGNGFLYNMVRIMAGTLLAVGEGKLHAAEIPRILQARDRALAGPTAKPYGLSLWSVEYEL
ncbi:tRNA pseudouridine(38-40) synthase TruA [Paenibacillus antri]|uniref:tRNA pseudouridine synthase A n=1 Tax=Paenibacillus antri TaxID=2582848 RepID=A0A5R9FWL7_9BACL|nr:tRNA pseudouridine(38-40) synthase TruA [Paenibacillus antri]TLS48387.1 tRNA pseudouridine(38-40) synthase TruA [Paenibacillus antri]